MVKNITEQNKKKYLMDKSRYHGNFQSYFSWKLLLLLIVTLCIVVCVCMHVCVFHEFALKLPISKCEHVDIRIRYWAAFLHYRYLTASIQDC